MDQDAYRKTYQQLNERFCVFEKAILAGYCGCARSSKFCLAEREGIHCTADAAQQRCTDLFDILRRQSRFTLKLGADAEASPHQLLPHNKAMRIQVGGLRGLCMVQDPDLEAPLAYIDDVDGLLDEICAAFGALEDLPFQEIIKQIAAFKGRLRKG